ncbi:MAG: hypothetical protein ACHQFW_03730 [Chitinophagales bacterium]
MRFPPNLKYFIVLILAMGAVAVGTIYLPRLIPNIGEIFIGMISIGMLVGVFFVIVKPFFTFLYARADGIFEVYMDKSEKGFHIFSYHINSGGESSMADTRDIQHYFILIETGKVYFKRMFSHSMEPATGRSGWGDFYGFEQSVLGSAQLTLSMHKLSAKSNMDLQLGRNIKSFGEDGYEIQQDEYIITIKKYSNVADEGYRVVWSNRHNERIVWKKRI